MTDRFHTVDPVAWELARVEYRDALDAYENRKPSAGHSEAGSLCDRLFAAEDSLLDQPAPDIDAVCLKLLAIWHDQIMSGIDDVRQKAMVIGDLRRISANIDCGVDPQDL